VVSCPGDWPEPEAGRDRYDLRFALNPRLPLMTAIGDQMGSKSLRRDIRSGDLSRLAALLVAGWVCGILWEFWNYWAEARWVFTFPIWREWKLFAMPLPGYLGFPPFA